MAVIARDASISFLKCYLTTAFAVGILDMSGIIRLYRPRFFLSGVNKLVCQRGGKKVLIDLEKIVRVIKV